MIEEISLLNVETGKTLLFNMKDADYLIYEGSVDWGNVSTTHNTFSYPSLIGEYLTKSTIGKRENVTIAGWIVGKTEEEIFTKKEVLSGFVNPYQTIRIRRGKYGISGRPQTNVKFSNTRAENNEKMCKFLIQFVCPYPLFDYNKDLSVSMIDITPNWHFGWAIPQEGYVLSAIKNTRFKVVNNNGTMPVGIRAVLEAKGIVNNPTIISITTQEQMRLNKVLHAGEVVEISTQKKRYVNGINGNETESYLDYFDFDNSWMQLAIGSNVLTVKTFDEQGNEDDTYKNLNVILYYNPCFLNLKEE